MILLYPFDFLARSEAFFETILPALFFFRSDFLRPPEVFSLVPLKTEDLPRLPLAMTDFFMAILRAIIFLAMAIFIFMLAIFMAAIFIILAIFKGGVCYKSLGPLNYCS